MVAAAPQAPDDTKAPPLVETRALNRYFGGVRALADVSVAIRSGEVLALVGDNGAGKTTFTRMLAGVDAADSGDLLYEGKVIGRPSPRIAQKFGIETVPQHLALCDNLDASMNFVLGNPPLTWRIGRFGIVDRQEARRVARAGLAEVGSNLTDFASPIRRMSGGQRQAIAIGRALHRGGRMVIFDEPTAALGVRQRETTLDLIRRVADRGLAAIVISHNIDDVFQVADRIVAFRLGHVVLDTSTSLTTKQQVRQAMEGVAYV